MVCVIHISSRATFQLFRVSDEVFSFHVKTKSIADLNKVLIIFLWAPVINKQARISDLLVV